MINEEMNSGLGNNSSMSLLGDYLKQKRLDKNFSLEKLSQKTKISVNILKSLEANDFENLPSAAYIKGFVTSYVKVLGLPLPDAINKMEYTYLNILGKPFPALNHTKLMSGAHPGQPASEKSSQEPVQAPHEVIESGDSFMENTKSILPFAIFVVVVLTFIGGYKLVSSIVESEVSNQRPKDLGPTFESSSALINNPKPKVEAPKPAEIVPSEVATTTPATATVTPAPVVEEKKPEEILEARNFPPIKFTKIKGGLFSTKSDAPENSDETILPANIKESIISDAQNVYIRAVSGNTWLSYKIDEKPITSQIINQGSDLYLQGQEIRLFLGNVNVTKIFYNNYLIDTPTRSGVKSLVFPETSNNKFFMPLFPKTKDDILYTAEEYMKRQKIEEDELAKKAHQ